MNFIASVHNIFSSNTAITTDKCVGVCIYIH